MTLPDIVQATGLGEPGKRVLVVEDNLDWLRRLGLFWEEAGHEVMLMAGVETIEENVARGAGADLQTALEVDLSGLDAAFLDHYFLSRRYNGTLLTREIVARGQCRVFGMSSVADANARMVAMGAVAALRKAEFMRLL